MRRHWSLLTEPLQLQLHPIQGGLESAVARAEVQLEEAVPAWPTRFIVKELRGLQRREVSLYRELWERHPGTPLAALLGSCVEEQQEYLFLEHVDVASSWPWAQIDACADVCRELARFHDREVAVEMGSDWDYERELEHSAASTLAEATRSRDADGKRIWKRLGDLRRVVRALPEMRRALLANGEVFLHGDMHPGNVMVRPDGRVVLIDWGRARRGSAWEDIASWLHSLACWVPEARRRHDTLLRCYLQHRARPQGLTASVRQLYHSASACNGLAGAIRYHIWVLAESDASQSARAMSRQALHAWERVIRHAAGLLRPVSDGNGLLPPVLAAEGEQLAGSIVVPEQLGGGQWSGAVMVPAGG